MFLNSIYNPGKYVDLRCCPCHDFDCDRPPHCKPCPHDEIVISIPKCAIYFLAGFMLNNFKR